MTIGSCWYVLGFLVAQKHLKVVEVGRLGEGCIPALRFKEIAGDLSAVDLLAGLS